MQTRRRATCLPSTQSVECGLETYFCRTLEYGGPDGNRKAAIELRVVAMFDGYHDFGTNRKDGATAYVFGRSSFRHTIGESIAVSMAL
jgi:hypothetical protein